MEPVSRMRYCYGSRVLCLAAVMAAPFVGCAEDDTSATKRTLNASAVREEVNEVVLQARSHALLCGDMMRSHPDAVWPTSGDRITFTADMHLYAKNGHGLVEHFSVNPSELTLSVPIPNEVRSCIEQAYLANDISFTTNKGDFRGRLELPMCIHPPRADEEEKL